MPSQTVMKKPTETIMADAFRRAGVDPEEAAFNLAIARWQNNGGSLERAIGLVRAAYEMSDEGQYSGANDGPNFPADVGHTQLPDEGQAGIASDGQTTGADVRRPNGDEMGHARIAESSHGVRAHPSPTEAGRVLRSVQLQREPTKGQIFAMAEARRKAAAAILRIDGRDIKDFTIGQLLTDARRKGKEHYILSTLGGMYKELPHTKRLGEVAADGIIESVVKQAEAYANAN